jgi:hypothetical protein
LGDKFSPQILGNANPTKEFLAIKIGAKSPYFEVERK